MRPLDRKSPRANGFALLASFAVGQILFAPPATRAAEIIRLSEATWDNASPHGKEVDCIYGDWVMRNDQIVAVIADAVAGRNANMTVRNVRGAVIDLTLRKQPNDQLSAYYPLNAQYEFSGPLNVDGSPTSATTSQGDQVTLLFRGPAADGHSSADVLYELASDAPWLKITTRVTNTSEQPLELKLSDAIRADGEFEFGQLAETGLFWAGDHYWRQTYGALLAGTDWQFVTSSLKRGDRPELKLAPKNGQEEPLAPKETREIVRYLFPSVSTVDAVATARQFRKLPLAELVLTVSDASGAIDGAEVSLKSATGEVYAKAHTDPQGYLRAKVAPAAYQAVVSAQGHGEKTIAIDATKSTQEKIELPSAGYVVAKITEQGKPSPCKVQFIGKGETPSPNFGPDSAIHGVRNLYYTHDGQFRQALLPGDYDVIISYGPEYDAVFTSINVKGGKDTELAAELKRVVDTKGWLSGDFHSHSTPSGDNTASQPGRVLNLLADQIEFAPCTEHNRITVYTPHLEQFGAAHRMLTCPGMELTGKPLPINHQNAFPLTPRPRTQDGGAPVHDIDPVVQIERLAMWENGSEKLVQINHPNIVQMIGDKDLNGSPDGGFEKMFSFVDVIEVHPLDSIFANPEALPRERQQGNTIYHWLQLINLGYRVPGVVNTDAHWNFHGSGWLRNYIRSSTDNPAEGGVSTFVQTCKHGNLLMTNGPFLEVTAQADAGGKPVTFGDDLAAPNGKLTLKIRVQRPNWFEVNRVQLFVNGKPEAKFNYSRRTHPKMFHAANVAFDESVAVELPADAHLVVACAGEDTGLGPVVGPDHAKDMPTAVGNPIFVDVDGGGFKPNGDMLGLPLPIEAGFKPSQPHRHD